MGKIPLARPLGDNGRNIKGSSPASRSQTSSLHKRVITFWHPTISASATFLGKWRTHFFARNYWGQTTCALLADPVRHFATVPATSGPSPIALLPQQPASPPKPYVESLAR